MFRRETWFGERLLAILNIGRGQNCHHDCLRKCGAWSSGESGLQGMLGINPAL